MPLCCTHLLASHWGNALFKLSNDDDDDDYDHDADIKTFC